MVEDTTLRKYLDGTLDERQSEQLKAQVEQDAELRNRLDALRRDVPDDSNPASTASDIRPVSPETQTASAHMGAMTEQVDRDVMPPTTEASEDTDTGITPHTEITPG